jgi:hypothetical protein
MKKSNQINMSDESKLEILQNSGGTIPDSKNNFDAELGTPTTIGSERIAGFHKLLDLKYPVFYFIKDIEGTAQIVTDILGKRHLVIISPLVKARPENHIPDFAHELCHAKFSEELDSIFSTLRFPRKYRNLSGEERSNFVRNAQIAEICQAYVDVWINDLRFEIDPSLTIEENDGVIRGIKIIAESGDMSLLTKPTAVISLAMVLAEQRRHKLKMPNILSIMKTYGREFDKINKLRDMMMKLPRITNGEGRFLPDIREKAIKAFEENAQKVSDILGYPIKPYLIDEPLEGGGMIKVWDFETKL